MRRGIVYTIITLMALATMLTADAGLAVAAEPAATDVGVAQALVYVDGVLTDGLNVSLYGLNDDLSRNLVGTMASSGGAYAVWPWGTAFMPSGMGGYTNGWVGWNQLPTTHADKDYVDYEAEIQVPAGLVATNGTVQGGFEVGREWCPSAAHFFCWSRVFEFKLERKPTEYKLDGYKFKDVNENGIMDSGEVGIPNVTINLDNGLATATTDSTGYFSFTVNAGTHTVAVDESTAPGYYPTTPTSLSFSEGKTVYFGNAPFGSISGKKWNDKNKNGKRDWCESPVKGVTIQLSGESVVKETVTAADGSYSFTGLNAGTYTVKEVVPSGWQAIGPTSIVVNLLAGQKVTGVDFFSVKKSWCG